jgi:hypothetical protein
LIFVCFFFFFLLFPLLHYCLLSLLPPHRRLLLLLLHPTACLLILPLHSSLVNYTLSAKAPVCVVAPHPSRTRTTSPTHYLPHPRRLRISHGHIDQLPLYHTLIPYLPHLLTRRIFHTHTHSHTHPQRICIHTHTRTPSTAHFRLLYRREGGEGSLVFVCFFFFFLHICVDVKKHYVILCVWWVWWICRNTVFAFSWTVNTEPTTKSISADRREHYATLMWKNCSQHSCIGLLFCLFFFFFFHFI